MFDPKVHDALCWTVTKNGIRWRRTFKTEDAAWRALKCGQTFGSGLYADAVKQRKAAGYKVVPSAWSAKKEFRKNAIHVLMNERKPA